MGDRLTELVAELRDHLPGAVVLDEPLCAHTSYRVGGPAAVWAEARGDDDVVRVWQLCRARGVPLAVLGNGSNTIAPDAGFEGVVLHLGTGFGRVVDADADHVWAEGGTLLEALARAVQARGRRGCEWMFDIPGSVGGALVMNASNTDGGMDQLVERARFLDATGVVRELPAAELGLAYRHSRFCAGTEIVLGALFRIGPAAAVAEIEAETQRIRQTRWQKFPLEHPNAGSVFKRPPGRYAGQLIEQCGLKGLRVGDAQVSPKHAGFIVNLGQATAADILELTRQVQRAVAAQTGVELQLEQKVLASCLDPGGQIAAAPGALIPERPG
ncbi:MAG: UDP-N-acetylmuramate dehydrogenase [Deltaproteobacteria bacterium]|nr:UDP-N-acetylmuramate dehydrogenase [Deltaproteobacteria bacterium]